GLVAGVAPAVRDGAPDPTCVASGRAGPDQEDKTASRTLARRVPVLDESAVPRAIGDAFRRILCLQGAPAAAAARLLRRRGCHPPQTARRPWLPRAPAG